MNSLVCRLVNGLCLALYKKEYRRYLFCGDVREAQISKLMETVQANVGTAYGREHGFCGIGSYEEFREKVPLTRYEDYRPYIDRIAAGEDSVLTAEKVLLFEPTGGSTFASKWIPYTESLRGEFQKALRPWIYDLYSSDKGILWGRSYWSITPAADQRQMTKGGIPVGFEDDTGYFGRIERRLLQWVFAAPQDLARERDMGEFYRKTALSLLKSRNLTLISVWNPTFFLLVLDYIQAHRPQLMEGLPKHRRSRLDRWIAGQQYQRIWPKLRVVSCWCDAAAAPYAEQLQSLFPGVRVQPKGLLATEGFVSFPLTGERGAALSIYSHFYEFIDIENGDTLLADQLKQGRRYEVVLTTGGGLYRYRMGDVVKVVSLARGIPHFVFVGRNNRTSDLFGEKLQESFVQSVLRDAGLDKVFAMVAPETDRYVLYIQTVGKVPDLDERFRENYHYDYCRKLGQLKPLRVFRLEGNPEKEYIDRCVQTGQRLGDVKPVLLSLSSGWDRHFQGRYAEE